MPLIGLVKPPRPSATALFQTFGFTTVNLTVKQVEPAADQPADNPVETGEEPVADTVAS